MSAFHSRSGSVSNISIASSSFVNNSTINNDDFLNSTDFDITTSKNNNSGTYTDINTNDQDNDDILSSDLLPNAIFNLTQNVNYKRKSTTTNLLSLNSSSTVISLNGPTTKDIPSIKLTHVDSIPYTAFSDYLDGISEYYYEFSNSKSLTINTLRSLNTVTNEQQEAALDKNNLKHIPQIYFEKQFRLDNPRIFNQIISMDKSNQSNSNDLLSSIDYDNLQEKLSLYLDIVEVNLIKEISDSSDSFFSALDDLKKITNSSNILKNKLQIVDNKFITFKDTKFLSFKKLLGSIKKYQNIEKFNQILFQIKLILTQADKAEEENLKGNYNTSLKLIDSVFALINGNYPPNALITDCTKDWNYPLSDLNRLPALSPLKHQLSGLITDTGKSFAKLFTNTLIDDLRSAYENLDGYKYLQVLICPINIDENFNSKYRIGESTKEKTIEYLTGLTRCGELISAFKLYEEKFHNEIKYILKSNLPHNHDTNDDNGNGARNNNDDDDDDDTESKSTNITNNLSNALALSDLIRNMTPKEFEDMLIKTFTELSIAFKRLVSHKDFLFSNVIDALNNFDPKILKSQPDFLMNLDISKLINMTISSIQKRIAKIIKIREQKIVIVPLDCFLRFHKLATGFLADCELISKGLVNDFVLRDLINRQLFIYLQSFHKACLKRVVEVIELEQWKDDGLPIYCQDTLNLFYKSSTGDLDENEWFDGLNLDFQLEQNKKQVDLELDIRKTLSLHGQNYILPKSTNHLLNILKNYLIIVYYFNGNITNTISQSYIPELLKLMNLKIHQSVLGAQATKTAGLKHVTTKHLALAGEVCRFWSLLVLDIERICLTKFESNKIKSEDTDKIRKNIKKEFQESRSLFMEQVVDIYDKLIAIMKETATSIINSLTVDDFLKNENLQDFKVCPYMESIVKKTLTIAKSVQRYLPEEEYNGIMNRIFEEYEKILNAKYSAVISAKTSNEIVKSQVRVDLAFFMDKLQDISDVRQIVDKILNSNQIELMGDSNNMRSVELKEGETKNAVEITKNAGGENEKVPMDKSNMSKDNENRDEVSNFESLNNIPNDDMLVPVLTSNLTEALKPRLNEVKLHSTETNDKNN